jgi:hypothetical protein
MGRTVPSFRIALEREIASWQPFRKALKSKESRVNLERLFNQARSKAPYSGNAVRPAVFEGMFMGIVHSQAVRLEGVSRGIAALRSEMAAAPANGHMHAPRPSPAQTTLLEGDFETGPRRAPASPAPAQQASRS